MTVNLAGGIGVVRCQAVLGSRFMRPHQRLAVIQYPKDDVVPDSGGSC